MGKRRKRFTEHLLTCFVFSLLIILAVTAVNAVIEPSYGPEILAEQDRIMALAFESLNERYNVNVEEWNLDRPNFAIKGIDNRITTFNGQELTGDTVVFVYGTAPNHTNALGGRDFPYYAIYNVATGKIIDARFQWVEE